MSVVLYVGPMFAGKTKSMLKHVRDLKEPSIFAKPLRDTRSKKIVTHDGDSEDAYLDNSLVDIVHHALSKDISVIGVDEGQFFEDLVEGICLATHLGISLVIAALSGTSNMKPFLNVSHADALADRVVHITARCKCGKDAAFTKRKVKSDQVFLIGGENEYEATCRACHSNK